MNTKQQPEALRLANVCSNLTRYSMDAHLIAAELLRLHAYCQELESQVIRDCMTHAQNPTENEHVAGDVSKNGVELNMSTQQPAAEATEEVENLRKSLVYVAFALHATPQYMLAQGITLIDGDTVRVSRDGWTVEASVNPHRQPAPATQQAGGRVYAFRRKGLPAFCTCDEALYEELSNKPHLFETRIFYTTPQPTHAQRKKKSKEQ